MRKSLVSILVGIGLGSIVSGLAFAEDMKTRAPSNWSGFYIGAHAAWDSAREAATVDAADPLTANYFSNFPGFIPPSYSAKGQMFGGGVQLGYNWQWQQYLFGLEADVNSGPKAVDDIFTNFGGPAGVTTDGAYSAKIDGYGTFRARAGFLITPNLLAYGTGGFAVGEISRSWAWTFNGNGSLIQGTAGSSKTFGAGWTGGGGLEWMFGEHFSLRAEYLYVTLGDNAFSTSSVSGFSTVLGSCANNSGPGCNFNIKTAGVRDQSLRLTFNYLFGR